MRAPSPSPLPVSGPAARAAAQAELRRAEYHRDNSSLGGRALHWTGRRVEELLSGTGGSNAVLLLLLLVGLVLAFAAIRAGRRHRTVRARGRDADPLLPVADVDHRRLARDHETAGRRPEALREWLRAAVSTIEQRGVLASRPGRTGAATAAEAGPLLPDAAPVLLAATAAFDEVWFGGRAATDADVRTAHAAADAVMSARPVPAAPGNGHVVPW